MADFSRFVVEKEFHSYIGGGHSCILCNYDFKFPANVIQYFDAMICGTLLDAMCDLMPIFVIVMKHQKESKSSAS